ncbi:TonB-dependent siderophore receptor [Paraburkholderia acidisoli]|uniref:TonB-dependent siderophore receptor n=1 Tax=Paraburkholderia acidisoli TaxID=2571748 RepID=A0A7Z2GNJ5_9BURK|nr:TonB-dependent siderophore receptor [Paraburkholderia acidisoli]QGZ65071.1 TonB-dependent siderophore receptor [Paraburkholderia acidisoli]
MFRLSARRAPGCLPARSPANARRPAALIERPLVSATRAAIVTLTGALIATGALTGSARAQAANQAPSASEATHRFDIAAGSLTVALNRVAQTAGVYLSGTGDLTEGKSSTGLHGRYTVSGAFSTLLAGSGLEAVPGPNGQYMLRAAPAGAAADAMLPAIAVRASNGLDATTEGSGSYAAKASTVAGRVAQSIKETPASVSVLTRERMNDQNMTTLQEALRYVTGVESIDYGDGTAYFRARGNQLGVEFDGTPIASGLQYKPQFDLAMYDRVEVLRGPAGVMSGMEQPGGTVNLVRKRPQDQFHVSTETQIGTFGSVRQMVDVTGPLNKEGTVRGRAVIVGGDGLQSVDATRKKEFMAYGALDFDLTPRTTLSLSGTYEVMPLSGVDYGASGVYNSTLTGLVGRVPSSWSQNFTPSWSSAFTSVQEANADLTHRFENGWQSETTLFYRHQLLKSYYAYSGPGALANGYSYFGDQRQRASFDWFGADTHVSGPIQAFGRTHTFTIGANYSLMTDSEYYGYQRVTGPGIGGTWNLFDPNVVPEVPVAYTSGVNDRLEQYGLYAQARIRIADPLTLVLGAREAFLQERTQSLIPTVDDWQTEAQVNHRFLPSAGIVWDIVPSMTAYASYSRFLAAQTQTTYTGSMLPPRSGEQYEVGVKNSFFGDRLSTTVALFRIDDNNRAISDPVHANGYIPGGAARDQGVEFEIAGKPTANWNVYAGYTYLNVRYDDDTANLTDGTDPRHLFKLWTDYKFSQGMLRNVSIGGGMLAQSQITRGVVQGGYAIFNAQVGYRFNKHVEATLQLNNLFNRGYYLRPPGRFYSVMGDRRNAMLTVRSDF